MSDQRIESALDDAYQQGIEEMQRVVIKALCHKRGVECVDKMIRTLQQERVSKS